MKLRTGLLLLFGLTLVAFSAVVAYARITARELLFDQVKLSLRAPGFRPFEATRTLVLKSEAVVYDKNPVTFAYSGPFVTSDGDLRRWLGAKDPQKFAEVMKKLRAPQDPQGQPWDAGDIDFDHLVSQSRSEKEAWNRCNAYLLSLSAELQTLMGRGRERQGSVLDLVLVTDGEGRPLAEQHTLPDGSLPNPDEILEPRLSPQAEALIHRAIAGDTVADYQVYGDGNLYLSVAQPLSTHGVLLLGSRVDQRFLTEAGLVAGDGVMAEALITGQDQVIGPPGPANADLAHLGHPNDPANSPAVRVILGGSGYLVAQRALGEARPPVAWLFFIRPIQEIEGKLDDETRTIATTGGLVGFLCLLAILALTGRVTRPIESLSEHMVRVGQGDLSQKADLQGTLEVARAAESFNQMVLGLRQKEEALKFLPQQTREEIAKTETGGVKLGGQRIKGTILFSDVRGFTSMSERLPPQAVIEILNLYLNRMTDTILRHQGDVNEFIGDAILAVFRDKEGARQAVAAALEMDAELKQLKETTANQDLREMVQGIGIHTGELVDGNIGTRERKKGALIGDTVNLAARIQDRSRNGRHTCILVSDATRQDLGDYFELDLFGDEEFKGKSAPVRVWEVVGRKR